MLGDRRVVVVMPAYNARSTLRRTVAEIDRSIVDEILMVDDASTDATTEEARRLGLVDRAARPEPGLRGMPEDLLLDGAWHTTPTSS